MKQIPRLQLITDETLQQRFSHVQIAELAAEAGVEGVQLREKRPCTTRELIETARSMLAACAGSRTSLIVDDRADVALSAGAPALHLGRNDLDTATARRILGESIIGQTANSYDEAIAVSRSGADYLGVGPIYGTQSKANPAPTMGLETLERICRDVPLPIIAIGSITLGRIPEVLDRGAYGVAVLSYVLLSDDPPAAARACQEAVATHSSKVIG